MKAELIGQIINAAIPILGGLYASLLGFRVIGKRPGTNVRVDAFHKRYGILLKLCGPLTLAYGLFQIVRAIYYPTAGIAPDDWKRYQTIDGVFSVEFPKLPKKTVETEYGVECTTLVLSNKEYIGTYRLGISDISPDAPAATVQERLDQFKISIPIAGEMNGKKYVFLREEVFIENGTAGRILEFSNGGTLLVRTKIFIIGNRIYRLVLTKTIGEDDPVGDRIWNSFRLEKTSP